MLFDKSAGGRPPSPGAHRPAVRTRRRRYRRSRGARRARLPPERGDRRIYRRQQVPPRLPEWRSIGTEGVHHPGPDGPAPTYASVSPFRDRTSSTARARDWPLPAASGILFFWKDGSDKAGCERCEAAGHDAKGAGRRLVAQLVVRVDVGQRRRREKSFEAART